VVRVSRTIFSNSLFFISSTFLNFFYFSVREDTNRGEGKIFENDEREDPILYFNIEMEYVQELQLTIFIAIKQIIIYQNMFFDRN
jgi:hypothetical protein